MQTQIKINKNFLNSDADNTCKIPISSPKEKIINDNSENRNLEKAFSKSENTKENCTNNLNKTSANTNTNTNRNIKIQNQSENEKEINNEDLEFSYIIPSTNIISNTHNNNLINNFQANFTNNILYFLDENFFLELENENSENFNFVSSLENWSNNNNINNNINNNNNNCSSKSTAANTSNNNFKRTQNSFTPVPIRCKNPFEKSLNIEGSNRIRQFFNEEFEKNNNNLTNEDLKKFNSQPEFIENFLFLEKTNIESKKINICNI